MNTKMGVISPEGLQLRAVNNVSRHLDTLEGKTIGEVYNNHFKAAFEYGISANEIKFASARARFLSSSISRNLKLSSGISNASCFPSRMQGACWRHPCSAWRPLGDEGLHATVVSFRYVILR